MLLSLWGSHKPFLRFGLYELLEIQLGSTGLVKDWIFKFGNDSGWLYPLVPRFLGPPFMVSQTKNRFVAVGCNNFASIAASYNDSVIFGGCMSVCDETGSVNASDCNGINYYQTAIPSGLSQDLILSVKPINDRKVGESVRSAFLVDTEWFKENFRMPILDNYTVAMAIQWQINSSLFNSLGLSGNAEGSSTSPTCHCSNQTALEITRA
ncbi:Wall-associated receptor kinase-like 2 [Morella rubra]|uniref:Wall-associated receptor kinase-like 2 n=1 Tax=Morella rubra TaxID=262757 RepID=A0A6A1VLB3_9ROSI|nr:Wall-associated receptor kinase-like 2 [Morella rubra]